MPASKTVRVRAMEGRIARVSPTGKMIPSDRFITVGLTPYIARLIHHWGDLELEPVKVSTPRAPEKKEA